MRASWIVILLVGCHQGAAPEASDQTPVQVTCKPVASQTVDESVEVNGVIAPPPKLDAVISSPVAGRIAQVAVEEGDRVAAGALLAVVEDPALPAGSVEAQAGVASAQATKQAADQDVARQTRLVESGIGARRDLDDAKAKAAAAAAELRAAGARDHLASQRLARRELRAPHAGVVLHVFKRTGESVDGTAATPIAEIADLGVLEVRAQVSPAVLVKLKEGLAARVHLETEEVAATVVRVSPAVDAATLLGSVRLELSAAKVAPPVGSAATARITIASHPALVVPPSALRRSAIGSDQVVVCEGGVAKVRDVELGHRGDSVVEVAKGLAAGDRIVVDHVLGLEDGQRLAAPGAK
ncbi:MAG: efflux RND transporter periplasmic adaptor subunit [Kofleriaceae bacterium]